MMLGMWVWPENVRLRGAEHVVTHCVRAGVTDLFFLTKGLAGTTAYRGDFAPSVCERDLLRELLDAAHSRGMRVHAWLTSASDEYYKRLHPESGRCHFSRGRDRELISLTDAGYLSYMEKIVRELCRRYEIDGLHLDYIRYNHLLYGWAEEDMQRYAAQGADIAHLRRLMERMFYDDDRQPECLFDAWRNGDESARALSRARRHDVVRFARTLTGVACAEKSGLTLSAALMPEGAYDDIAFSDLHYGQNYADMAQIFAYALPMAYSQAYGKDAAWVRKVAEGTKKYGFETVVGLHAYEGGTGLTLRNDLAALKDAPVDGVCLFREGATALAYAAGKQITLYNALAESVTSMNVQKDEECVALEACLLPGEEKTFHLPFEPDTVRVLIGETEKSVYLSQK